MSSTLEAPQAKAVKKKASGSSFYLAMRLMPEAERDAMFAIYAFCRKVDDIADDGIGTRAERQQRLAEWRTDIDALYRGEVRGQVRFLAPFVEATMACARKTFSPFWMAWRWTRRKTL